MEVRQRCPNCGSEVQSLAFCGVCGRPLPDPSVQRDDSPRGRLTALLLSVRERPVRAILLVAALIVFLLLLSGQAGLATLVALLIVPYVLLSYLMRLDLYEREPWTLMGAVLGAGALLGLLGGWLSNVIFEQLWFSDSRLNLGAVGFAGISANGEGGVPFSVILLSGIVVPALIGATVMSGPILLRRWPVFRNEILDGMTLGGLAAAGFVTVSSFVYFWPGVFDGLPDRPVEEWTAILAGTVVVRPIVLILAGSLLGIAAWQYASSRDVRSVFAAGVTGAFGWLALPLGSLVLTQSGAVAELVWYLIALLIVGFLFREALHRGLAQDRSVLSSREGDRRVICPNCRRVTPDGTFCSFCRAPLLPDQPAAIGPPLTATPFEPADEGQQVERPVMSRDPASQPARPSTNPVPVAPVEESATSGPGRSYADLADEPEADPLDYLLDDVHDPSVETVDPPDGQATELTARFDSMDDADYPDRTARNADYPDETARNLEPDDATMPPEPIGETVDVDAGLLPTGETIGPDLPLTAEGPGPEDAVVAPERPTSSESPWSNVRPFRSAAGQGQDKPATRPSWMPGVTRSPESADIEPTGEPAASSEMAVEPEVEGVSGPQASDRPGRVIPIEPPWGAASRIPRPDGTPVISSPDRWFGVSSGRTTDPATVSPDPGFNPEGKSSDNDQPQQPQNRDPGGDQVAHHGSADDPEGSDDPAKDDVNDAAPLSTGLRWSASESEEPASDGTDVLAVEDSQDWTTNGNTSLARSGEGFTVDANQDPEPSEEVDQRPGIWRQLTRRSRPSTPSAPRRDGLGQTSIDHGPGSKDGES